MGTTIVNTNLSILNILALYLILNIALSLGAIFFSLKSRDMANASLNAVFLLGWLAAFALLTGFSIGVIVAAAAVVFGIIFFFLFKGLRLPLGIATLIDVLVLLSLRGTFAYALIILLTILVAGTSATAAFLIINKFAFREERSSLAALGLAGSLSALGYFSFVSYPLISRWIMLLAAILSLFFAITLDNYRVKFVELLLGIFLAYAAFTGSLGGGFLPYSI